MTVVFIMMLLYLTGSFDLVETLTKIKDSTENPQLIY